MLPIVGDSAAIGNGDPSALPGPTDQRGYSDVVDGQTDIGAVETLGAAALADLAVSGFSTPVTVGGGRIIYTITVANASAKDSQQNVTLADLLPTGTTFVSWSTTDPAWTLTSLAAGGTGTVTASTDLLAAGASATFTLVVQVAVGTPNGSVISDSASVGPLADDPNPSNNSATIETPVQPSKVVDGVLDIGVAPNSQVVVDATDLAHTTVTINGGVVFTGSLSAISAVSV